MAKQVTETDGALRAFALRVQGFGLQRLGLFGDRIQRAVDCARSHRPGDLHENYLRARISSLVAALDCQSACSSSRMRRRAIPSGCGTRSPPARARPRSRASMSRRSALSRRRPSMFSPPRRSSRNHRKSRLHERRAQGLLRSLLLSFVGAHAGPALRALHSRRPRRNRNAARRRDDS